MIVLQKIVSGGQTGVDRAALDVAQALGIPSGGWCPLGRRAEDGAIAALYPLRETPTDDYECRTEWNVRDSDGTLILAYGALTGGTALTARLARQYDRPLWVVDLAAPAAFSQIRQWLQKHDIQTLNVAGPRESNHPGIYAQAADYLRQLLQQAESGYTKL